MSKIFLPEDYIDPPSRRLSSWKCEENGFTQSQWTENTLNYLRYQVKLERKRANFQKPKPYGRAFVYGKWIDENCEGYWSNSTLINQYLIKKHYPSSALNDQFKARIDAGDEHAVHGLINLFGILEFYVFELQEDAVLFRLYADG